MEINRYSKNPILTKENVPFKVNGILKPGGVKFNGDYSGADMNICLAQTNVEYLFSLCK